MREYDPHTGRLALKSPAPTVAETYEARGDDGRAEVVITGGGTRKHASTSKGALPQLAPRKLDPNEPTSYIVTGPYHPPERTKKEAEEFYRPPEGVPLILGGAW